MQALASRPRGLTMMTAGSMASSRSSSSSRQHGGRATCVVVGAARVLQQNQQLPRSTPCRSLTAGSAAAAARVLQHQQQLQQRSSPCRSLGAAGSGPAAEQQPQQLLQQQQQPQHPSGRTVVLAITSDATGSLDALHYTLKNIVKPGDCLHLLHVLPSSRALLAQGGLTLATTLPGDDGLEEAMAERARAYFERTHVAVARSTAAAPLDVRLDVMQGVCNRSVSALICSKVEELAAALVVLSVPIKRTFLQELFQPDISAQVAQHCRRPTLILHDA